LLGTRCLNCVLGAVVSSLSHFNSLFVFLGGGFEWGIGADKN
jgi:hypothetical protein